MILQLEGSWDRLCPYQITSIVDDEDGLTIVVEDNKSGRLRGRLIFSAHYAYRNFNEADLHGYWKDLGRTLASGLYVGNDTEFMRWAKQQTMDHSLHEDIRHYLVVSVEDVFEVLSFEPPIFEDQNIS